MNRRLNLTLFLFIAFLSIVQGQRTSYESLWNVANEDDISGTISRSGDCFNEIQVPPGFVLESYTELVKGVSFEMIAIEGDIFRMGSFVGDPDEAPRHDVTLSSFYIGKTEVTQLLWKALMGNNPSEFKGDNLPVENVSWNDIQKFIKKLNRLTGKNYRLPTEAEWEFAAGGRLEHTIGWSGTRTRSDVGDYAWIDVNSEDQTHEVALKLPNRLGLHDMTGNVWEWCNDWYGGYSSNDQTNPTGPESGTAKVSKGGGFESDYSECRLAARYFDYPDGVAEFVGFRLALVP